MSSYYLNLTSEKAWWRAFTRPHERWQQEIKIRLMRIALSFAAFFSRLFAGSRTSALVSLPAV
jgi:hypothetical protein